MHPLIHGDFVVTNFNMEDRTASKLELPLGDSKSGIGAFERQLMIQLPRENSIPGYSI